MKKHALITGASRGIGQAAAVSLAARGYNVAITARSVDALHDTEHKIRALGSKVDVFKLELDVLDTAACLGCVDAALKGLGASALNAVVHAAIYQGPALSLDIASLTPVELERAMCSFSSAVFIFQRAVPVLARDASLVLIVSSATNMRPTRPVAAGGWSLAYVAAKSAAAKVLPLLRVELAKQRPDVRCFNVEPGLVVTQAMVDAGTADKFRQWGDVPPQVCGEVIAHLASAPASSGAVSKANGAAFVYAPKLAHDLQLRIPGFVFDPRKAQGVEDAKL